MKPLGSMGVAALAVCAGCARGAARPADVTTTTAYERRNEAEQPSGLTEVSSGEIDRLARALCDRKLVCSEIGPDREFDTFDGCLTEARRHARDHLSTLHCPGGLDSAQLSRCDERTRAERCGASLDVGGEVPECSSRLLCVR